MAEGEHETSTGEQDHPKHIQTNQEIVGQYFPDVARLAEDPAAHLSKFERMESDFRVHRLTRRNEDGSRTTIVSYQRDIDPHDIEDLDKLAQFRVYATGAGLREAFAPLTIPGQAKHALPGKAEPDPRSGQLVVVQLGYENPHHTPPDQSIKNK